MKAQYRINWADIAKCQLDNIYCHIKAGSMNAGKEFKKEVRLKVLKLKIFPEMGQEEEQLKKLGQGHRYLVQGNYKIIYRVEKHEINIVSIFDARRDPSSMEKGINA